MKGNKVIIDGLNDLLSYELAAMDQYFIHSQTVSYTHLTLPTILLV